MAEAEKTFESAGRSTILFVDEIHRFNKAQQDGFLPYVEKGLIVLIGATTQNPSFEIIPPLLSRARVLTAAHSSEGKKRSAPFSRGRCGTASGLADLELQVEDAAIEALIDISEGDARVALRQPGILRLSCGGEGRGPSPGPAECGANPHEKTPPL